MLTCLKVNNCFIYNEEVSFSMKANMHQKRFINNVIVKNNANILKSAIVIGPNNSGKTNLVKIFQTIRGIILNNKMKLVKCFFCDQAISTLQIGFMDNFTEYEFEIKYDSSNSEYVYERFSEVSYDDYKNKKIKDLIVRDILNNNYYCENEELSIELMKSTSKNNLLIHLLDENQFSLLKKVKDILMNFALKIDVVDMNNIPFDKTIEILKKNSDEKQKVVNFILNSDLYLEDYRYLTDEEMTLDLSKLEELKPQENVFKVANQIIDLLHLSSVYKGISLPSLIFDSTGTKKMAALASYVIDALEKGRILIVDELDNSLHFRLTRAIISLFNNDLNDKAQLICTVQDISLLDVQKLFRKDQIWFTHKDNQRAYLYSLVEFTAGKDGVRETSDIIDKYKQGVFGALPEPNLLDVLMEKK